MTIDIGLDGNEIYKYAPEKVMAIVFHWPQDMDVDDTPDLQKSPIYDIKQTDMTFYIKKDKKFIDLFNRGAK